MNGSVAIYLRRDQLRPFLDGWKVVLPDGTPASDLLDR
jgi:hypothetical protein